MMRNARFILYLPSTRLRHRHDVILRPRLLRPKGLKVGISNPLS